MLATAIIARKRDGYSLTADEIEFMIRGMLDGGIPDYQTTAWAMAILCRGMNREETCVLTDAMLSSGLRLPRCSDRPRVDKHSTGGLGDKVSLILAPLLACFELDVPMLSGRGLGITGGTLDKLEAYSGYRCDLTTEEINRQLSEIGCVITGTTPDITPADRRLYALRDASGTVPSVPLITASILSKKLAESLDALVFDVKVGSGAFMSSMTAAQELATSLQETSVHFGLDAQAVLSDMNQPLGKMVGNACEANEAVDVLSGEGPSDVREVTFRLCAEVLVATNRASDNEHALSLLNGEVTSGRARERYIRMIEAQGGTFSEALPLAKRYSVDSHATGYLSALDGQLLGQAVIVLGGGRTKVGDTLDHSVGLEMHCRIGDQIESDQPLCSLFCSKPDVLDEAIALFRSSVTLSTEPVPSQPLFPAD